MRYRGATNHVRKRGSGSAVPCGVFGGVIRAIGAAVVAVGVPWGKETALLLIELLNYDSSKY